MGNDLINYYILKKKKVKGIRIEGQVYLIFFSCEPFSITSIKIELHYKDTSKSKNI